MKIKRNICVSVSDEILSIRDYTERLPAHFNLKIQSDNFGNDRSLSIEDYNIDFADIHHKLQSEYHSHLLDDN